MMYRQQCSSMSQYMATIPEPVLVQQCKQGGKGQFPHVYVPCHFGLKVPRNSSPPR